MVQNELNSKLLAVLVDECRKIDADPVEAMNASCSAAVQFMVLVSETAGRNTLQDLYCMRRQLTEIINNYKKGCIYE